MNGVNHCCGVGCRSSPQRQLLPGEVLAQVAWEVNQGSGRLLIVQGPVPPDWYDKVALAVDFHKQGPVFAFRAIAEEWDWQRLMLEMYT